MLTAASIAVQKSVVDAGDRVPDLSVDRLDRQCAPASRRNPDAGSSWQVFAIHRPPGIIKSDASATLNDRLLQGGSAADKTRFALVEEWLVGCIAVPAEIFPAKQGKNDGECCKQHQLQLPGPHSDIPKDQRQRADHQSGKSNPDQKDARGDELCCQ
ncbi:Hypothetical protein AT6N2_L1507 [Agrobacterium tumefaciens]|nr:Hypothetical protein AT6N2_L1507 [Agrobacterium tumefaciens]